MRLSNLPIHILLVLLDHSTLSTALPVAEQPLHALAPRATYSVVPIDGSSPNSGPGSGPGNGGNSGNSGGHGSGAGSGNAPVTVEKTLPPTTVTVTTSVSIIDIRPTSTVTITQIPKVPEPTSVPSSTPPSTTTPTTSSAVSTTAAPTETPTPDNQPNDSTKTRTYDDGLWTATKYPGWNGTDYVRR